MSVGPRSAARRAIARVADRVRRGGHHIPDQIVRRRYHGGLRNFFRLYRPMATTWRLYDNASSAIPRLVARGGLVAQTQIFEDSTWQRIDRGFENEHQG